MKILRYLSALSLAAGPSFAQRDVEDLFQVNFGTNNLGGCGYVGRDRMNMALRDSLNLVNAGIRLIDEIDQAPDAQRLAEAFWRGSNQAQRTIIRRKYTLAAFLGLLANTTHRKIRGRWKLACERWPCQRRPIYRHTTTVLPSWLA
jgi:hypothetical protein